MNLLSFKDNCGFGLLASIDNIPSHKNVEDAVIALERMMHRGAIAADGKSGDGSGLLFGMPDKFMRKMAIKEGIDLPETYGIGVIFTKDDKLLNIVKEKIENTKIVIKHKLGANGHLYGAITNKEVAEHLKEKGIEIDKKQIDIKQIKAVGEYSVDVKLGHGIHAKLDLVVEGE